VLFFIVICSHLHFFIPHYRLIPAVLHSSSLVLLPLIVLLYFSTTASSNSLLVLQYSFLSRPLLHLCSNTPSTYNTTSLVLRYSFYLYHYFTCALVLLLPTPLLLLRVLLLVLQYFFYLHLYFSCTLRLPSTAIALHCSPL
jgi:hypothetical protein